MGPSVAGFRPDDPLTSSELAVAIASLGGAISVADPNAPVTVRELDARLVTLAGLRPAAQAVRVPRSTRGSPLDPGSEPRRSRACSAFRVNHPREEDELELEVTDPMTQSRGRVQHRASYLVLTDGAGQRPCARWGRPSRFRR